MPPSPSRIRLFAVVLGLLLTSVAALAGEGSSADNVRMASQFLDMVEKARFQRTRALGIKSAIQLMHSEDSANLKRAFDLLEKEITQPPRRSTGMLYSLIALESLPHTRVYEPNLDLIAEKARLAMQVFNLPESAYKPDDGDPSEHEGSGIPTTLGSIQYYALRVILANGSNTLVAVPEATKFVLSHLDYNEHSQPLFGPDMLRMFAKGCVYVMDAAYISHPEESKKIFEMLVAHTRKRLDVNGFNHLYQFQVVTDLIDALTKFTKGHGGGESFLALLELIIKNKGRFPLTEGSPISRSDLFCAASLSKEKIVTDWTGGEGDARRFPKSLPHGE